MEASWYAEALYKALQGENVIDEGDSKKVFARFKKVISARGHDRLIPFIGREFEKVVTRENKNSEVILVTADNKSKNKWMHAYDHYKKEKIIPKGSVCREVVDESIIGGFQIRTKDILIDGTYKKSLVELYRKITS